MIYLEPIGGLGNRMRTIDSMISWCKVNQKEITILWNVDRYLNCAFEELFEPLFLNGARIRVINLPQSNRFFWKRGVLMIPKLGKFIRSVKSVNKIKNDDLFVLYDSKYFLNKVELVSEVDEFFYPKVKISLDKLLENDEDYWIESCYRMYPHELYYQEFVPVLQLKSKIDLLTANFKSTIGLHIRRTDHSASIEFSTLDIFTKIIEAELKKDINANFFVCSDTHETIRDLKLIFGDKILYNEIESYDRNNKQAIFDAVIDLYCLAATHKIYGSYFSSFSQVAADIGRVPEISVK